MEKPIIYEITKGPDLDQIEYIEGVREWLHQGIRRDKLACGPKGAIPLKSLEED